MKNYNELKEVIKQMIAYNNCCKSRTKCIYSKDRYTGIVNALSEVLKYIEKSEESERSSSKCR